LNCLGGLRLKIYSRILITPCIKECKVDNATFDFCQPEAVIFVEENIRPAQDVSPRFRSGLHKFTRVFYITSDFPRRMQRLFHKDLFKPYPSSSSYKNRAHGHICSCFPSSRPVFNMARTSFCLIRRPRTMTFDNNSQPSSSGSLYWYCEVDKNRYRSVAEQ
jgi:hypothetical protein